MRFLALFIKIEMIILISRDEVNRILDMPFNPAVVYSEEEKDHVFEQWYQVRNIVKSIFDNISGKSSLDDDDYGISDQPSLSRGIHVEVFNENILSRQLLEDIKLGLEMLPEKYEVYIFVDVEDNFSHLFIQHDSVRAFLAGAILDKITG